ncbi:MAG: bifunctional metallophosphatase/5'-nucleotidase [Actinomycetales bacterium]|nr:bifunctional metallophosphatase/5'-nucleotidase [Actinomycetales bacterium]
MAGSRLRMAAVGVIALAVTAVPSAAQAGKSTHRGNPNLTTVQILSFNDYHGHLEATDPVLAPTVDPSQTPVGGAEHLATTLTTLRAKVGAANSLTVAAGDLIGGSPFLSGIFHDEPAVESLNAMKLDVSAVGNHEFDEGTTELLRMQNGGCHPVAGCYFTDAPYAGADFQWLAANVVRKDTGTTLLPGTSVKTVNGVRVGFIGMTLEATPALVNPSGVASVAFRDEVLAANAQARLLKKQGVKAIVVLLHEGGYQAGDYRTCSGISDPIAQIASTMTPEVDLIVSGHTHQAYICSLPDPAGHPRLVTSAADYGRAVTETSLVVNRASGEVDRARTKAVNHLNARTAVKDPVQTGIIAKWTTLAGPIRSLVVGSVAQSITGDASGNRGIETPMGDLVADAMLAATKPAGAQLAFMNVGGVRASLLYPTSTLGEGDGKVTYSEAYAVTPFGNVVLSLDMTGDQIRQVLEQQYQPIPARGSRPMLALGVSEGFTYIWDSAAPQGSRVVPGSMALHGVPVSLTSTYRVGVQNFLADGGDSFTAFLGGTNRIGAAEDLAAFITYLQANPGLLPPPDRIAGL